MWGELFVTRGPGAAQYAGEDVEFAVAVAAQAHTDTLTGLANRLAVEEWFEVAM